MCKMNLGVGLTSSLSLAFGTDHMTYLTRREAERVTEDVCRLLQRYDSYRCRWHGLGSNQLTLPEGRCSKGWMQIQIGQQWAVCSSSLWIGSWNTRGNRDPFSPLMEIECIVNFAAGTSGVEQNCWWWKLFAQQVSNTSLTFASSRLPKDSSLLWARPVRMVKSSPRWAKMKLRVHKLLPGCDEIFLVMQTPHVEMVRCIYVVIFPPDWWWLNHQGPFYQWNDSLS